MNVPMNDVKMLNGEDFVDLYLQVAAFLQLGYRSLI
jgi:hypothetical protein